MVRGQREPIPELHTITQARRVRRQNGSYGASVAGTLIAADQSTESIMDSDH